MALIFQNTTLMVSKKLRVGFTLAEVLIALVLLGVIAAFTLPKILQSSQNEKYNAIAHEAMAMISEAYQLYRQNNTPTAATGPTDLVPFMNTLGRVPNPYEIDYQPNAGFGIGLDCNIGQNRCIRLHNGAVMDYHESGASFSNTTNNSAIWFYIDPNGKYDGQVESLIIYLYINGKIRTGTTIDPGTLNAFPPGGVTNPVAGSDPPWFHW